jgi:polysaccharide pyruvyl transferase WcaK-like protein
MLMGAGTSVCGYREITLQWAKTCFPLAPHRIVFGSGVVNPDFVAKVVGPAYDVHKRWADVLNQCDYIGVRGPLSKKELEDLGLKNIEVIGDPVMSLAREQLPREISGKDKIIGLNVGVAGGNLWGREDYICEQFAKLAQIANHSGFRVKWFVIRPGDLDVTRQAFSQSGMPADICEFYNDFNGFMDAVSLTNIFVGMKLHAVALATCAYVPSVMLEYNPKCRDYMDSINQSEFTLRTDNFTSQQVWDMVENLLAKRSYISKSLFEVITGFRKLQLLRSSQLIEKFGLK